MALELSCFSSSGPFLSDMSLLVHFGWGRQRIDVHCIFGSQSYPYHADFKFCLQFVCCVDVHSHNDGGRAERPSVLSMSSSRSRKNRSSTSPDPASAPARSPLSLSKSRDGGPATSDSDDDGHHPRRHSRIDANEPRQGPSAPTAQRKADNDDVAAVALPFSLSLTLKNTGSVARDHLASERTFLAYVRTSLSFASAGVGASFLALPVFISSFL